MKSQMACWLSNGIFGGIVLSLSCTNATSQPPNLQSQVEVVKSQAAADAYSVALQKELSDKYKLSGGVSLLGNTEEETLSRFYLHGPAADGATLKIVDVQGQPFRKVMRMDVHRLSGEFWHTMLRTLSKFPVKKGDKLLVTLYARGGVDGLAGSPAFTGVAIKPIPGASSGFATRDLILYDKWQKVQMPVEVKEDRDADKVEWISVLATKLQWIEFGGISVLNFGPNANFASLPNSNLVRHTYVGREPNAVWRKEALKRINTIRKGSLRVLVKDASGNPVPNADVKINMTRHAFRWGTAMVPSIEVEPIPDWNRAAHEAQFKHLDLFNSIAVDIDLKFDRWYGSSDESKQQVLKGLQMFKDRGMAIHGHTMIWPGFSNMPQAEQWKAEPTLMREKLREHIREIGQKTALYCESWDVVNEPFQNQQIVRIVGKDAIADWFRTAREVLPRTKLFINEGFGDGVSTTELYYYEVCKKLVEDKAPLDGIGFQSHMGGTPLNIPTIWDSWQKFAALKPGIELAVSEYDVNFNGDSQLEADFTRDFTILAFSNPNMVRFTLWGFHDPYHWLKYAPLFDANGNLKPSGKAWVDLVHKQWWTNVEGKSNTKGEYSTRGFLGEYEIVVMANGKTRAVKTSLPKKGQTITVKLS